MMLFEDSLFLFQTENLPLTIIVVPSKTIILEKLSTFSKI